MCLPLLFSLYFLLPLLSLFLLFSFRSGSLFSPHRLIRLLQYELLRKIIHQLNPWEALIYHHYYFNSFFLSLFYFIILLFFPSCLLHYFFVSSYIPDRLSWLDWSIAPSQLCRRQGFIVVLYCLVHAAHRRSSLNLPTERQSRFRVDRWSSGLHEGRLGPLDGAWSILVVTAGRIRTRGLLNAASAR